MLRPTQFGSIAGCAQRGARWLALAALLFVPNSQAQPAAAVTLDHVVAAVNGQPILASDIDEQIRLAVLEPDGAQITRKRALDDLIGQALIQQQIRQQQALAAEASPAEVAARLAEIRASLPACRRAACATDDDWRRFLAAHALNNERVLTYLKLRIEVLNFIEQRFRAGIHVGDEEIRAYYNDQLLPLYPAGEKPPALETVSKRIEEILLQQRVTVLFDDWLNNLRQEGDVEIMDSEYEALASRPRPAKAGE